MLQVTPQPDAFGFHQPTWSHRAVGACHKDVVDPSTPLQSSNHPLEELSLNYEQQEAFLLKVMEEGSLGTELRRPQVPWDDEKLGQFNLRRPTNDSTSE